MSPSLADKLRDSQAEVRKTALDDVANLEKSEITKELQENLLQVLTDSDPQLVAAGLETLGQWAQRKVMPDSVDIMYAVRRSACHDHPRIRSEAAVALVLMDEPASEATIKLLLKLLDDEHPRVRQEAAAALGDTKDPTAIPALQARLEDEDSHTRFEVSFALASLGNEQGLPLLLAETNSSRRRLDALEGIRRLGDPSALETLRTLSTRFFLGWPERLTVYATMYTLGAKEAADYMLERAQTRNKSERSLAIGLIGTHQVKEAFSLLESMALDHTHKFQLNAVHAMGELRDSRVPGLLEAVLANGDNSHEVIAEAKASIARRQDSTTY